MKLNLGCGTNKIAGWENHDTDVDISKPLKFANSSVNFIFIEHCVEHVSYYQAIAFFEECRRVLVPGGVLRVTVPSVERVWKSDDEDYFRLAAKWGKTPDRRGAMDAIINCHGHKTCWTSSLMLATLKHVGFASIEECRPGFSSRPELVNLEGHGRVIGNKFNDIESISFEAAKDAVERRAAAPASTVAIVVGGAEGVEIEIEQARALCAEAGMVPQFFIVNDMISHFPDEAIVVSLHPDKIPGWLSQRRRCHYPEPREVWAHNYRANNKCVTHTTRDWGGSSGLFAVKVALEKDLHWPVILCGVPMEIARNHFIRKVKWIACQAFWRSWLTHKGDLARVRSFSGATAELLGRPDLNFLRALAA